MPPSLSWARTAAAVVAWTTTALVIAETVSRQLTRTRLIRDLPGDPLWLAVLPMAGVAALLLTRWRWRSATTRRPAGLTAAVFAALFASGLAMQLQLGARLQSDGFYYFAYLRSIAFDRDVNFMNDYRLLGLGDKRNLFEPTVTGHAHSAWTIGPAIVWSPFFGVGHMAATRLRERGREVAIDGTAYPYRQAICIAGLVYALLGLWFSIRAARLFFPAPVAATSGALTIGGSFMLWYSLAEPTMTHAPSMAAVAGFLWYWLATSDQRRLIHWVGLGLVAGLMTLIRWQNALFVILPASEAVFALRRASQSGSLAGARPILAGGLAFAVAATIAFAPQMLAWKAIYGHYLAVSPVGPQIRWWDPHLIDVLFSSRNGLFAMSPVLYVAAVGLVVFAWRRPTIGGPAVAAFAAMIYFNASIQDWWGSAGYGGRRFDGVVAVLVLGMAAAFESLRGFAARRPKALAAAVLAAGVVWNLTLMGASSAGAIRPGEAIMFAEAGAAQARLVHGWIGHPFSYPVNLWFAARNRMSPAAYDLLAALAFLSDPTRPYGRVDLGTADEPFVLDGWSAPAREGDVTFRGLASAARLVVPLDFAADLDLQLRVRGPAAGAHTLTVDTEFSRFGPIVLAPDWQTHTIATPRSAWRAGVNRLRFSLAPPMPAGMTPGHPEQRVTVDYVRIQVRPGGAPR